MFTLLKKFSDDEIDILSYLYENQNSKDTLDGILHWWLLDRDIKNKRFHIKKTINKLIKNGYLIEDRYKNTNNIYYGINKESIVKLEQIIKVINKRYK